MSNEFYKNSALARTRYNKYFDRGISQTPQFNVGDTVYLGNSDPLLSSSSRRKLTHADEFKTENRYKFMFKKTEQLKVTALRPYTLFIDDNAVDNTVSVYLLTLSQSLPNLHANRRAKERASSPHQAK